MSRFFDCSVPAERTRGIEQAAQAARRGQLVVLPTDTVYGLGCDAFSAPGVRALLAAKGRGRDMPVPVLVGSPRTLDGLAATLTQQVRDLVEAFWPGPLTVVCREAPSLVWDLGDTGGTVAVRMPLHPVAIELLRAVGPMAVSSANSLGPATGDDPRRGRRAARRRASTSISTVGRPPRPCPRPSSTSPGRSRRSSGRASSTRTPSDAVAPSLVVPG